MGLGQKRNDWNNNRLTLNWYVMQWMSDDWVIRLSDPLRKVARKRGASNLDSVTQNGNERKIFYGRKMAKE